MKTTKWFALVALLAVPLVASYAQTPAAPAPAAPEQATAAIPASLSPGAAEVVKLATSGVGDEVVLSYIQNSQAQFNLSADDVLYLKDIGLSPAVTSAMLNHDSTLRGQSQQYAPAATTPVPAAPAPVAPAPAVVPAPTAAPTVAAAPAPAYVTTPPADVAYFYNDLAPYGTWVQLEGYGWCWQPTTVVMAPSWRPYCDGGYWVYSDVGWYWQSSYSWGWAPFHYGRWYMHPRCGWVWWPDRVWGPAWVTWRTGGDYCGWAPLPPHAEFDVRLGWRFNGVSVGASFDFGLGINAFAFIGFGDFCSHDLHRYCLPPARVGPMFHQTTIINNYVVNNNRIEHRGIPIERVSGASRVAVPRANVRDWAAAPGRMPTRAGAVVYRPRLEAPSQPVHMQAQRIDAQHPVIQHTLSGPPRVQGAAVSGRGAQSPAGASRRQTLESPKTSAWSSSTRPEASRQSPSAPSAPQNRSAIPSGKAPSTSYWSREAQPASSSQIRSTPSAPQTTPATSAGRAPQTSTWSRGTGTAASTQIQSSPSAAQTTRTIPAAASTPRAPEEWKQGARSAPSYRSDAGLPALYNTRTASQPTPATGQTAAPTSSHVYPPKSALQAAEIRSMPSSGSSSLASRPSTPSGSDSHSRKDR